MKLINLLPVRNEAWVLGLSLRSMLKFCDGVVLLLHACTDGSEAIAQEAAEETGRVTILVTDDPTWREMEHRQMLLEEARERGATHIATLDADELLTGNLLSTIRDFAESLEPRDVLNLPGYNLRNGIDRYHSNGVWGNRWFSAIFRDHEVLHWNGDRFHHRHPMGSTRMRNLFRQGDGGIMHLWGASERRLIARHRAYKIAECLRWPHKPVREIDEMYSLAIHGKPRHPYGTPATWQYAPVPAAWWEPYRDLMSHLDLDSPPTQEAEVERLIAEHGIERFAGLDLFGVKCEQETAVPA